MRKVYKYLYMKLINVFEPKLKDRHAERQLVSTFVDVKELPVIEMKLLDNIVAATVKFKFYYNRSLKAPIHKKDIKKTSILKTLEIVTRVISGPSELVYSLAAKQASKISLSLSTQFNHQWQRSLMNLLNAPSKNKTILNLGLYKNNNYGIFDIEEPKNLLQRLMSENDIQKKDLATLAGVDQATIYRHLNGETEISRNAAVKYAKVLGCDPTKILFNDLVIPVWGSTDTMEQLLIEKLYVYASEIIPLKDPLSVTCPREIYRPDVKAIKIDSPNSSYHGHVAYYHNTNSPIVLENQIVVVGTKINNETRIRYFIGTYKKNKNGRTVDLHTIDTSAIDVSGVEPDEDLNSFEDIIGLTEAQKIIIENITPEFVAPVVALVEDRKVNDPIKSAILKAYEEIYTKSRKGDAQVIEFYKDLQRKSAAQSEIEDFVDEDTTDFMDLMEARKVKSLIKADKELNKVISTAAYGSEKDRKIIGDKVKKIKYVLDQEEQKAVDEMMANYEEDYGIDSLNLTPEEVGN
jgi:DNA-binding XRE family transcriptional regulator